MMKNFITFNTDTAFEIIYKQLFVKKHSRRFSANACLRYGKDNLSAPLLNSFYLQKAVHNVLEEDRFTIDQL